MKEGTLVVAQRPNGTFTLGVIKDGIVQKVDLQELDLRDGPNPAMNVVLDGIKDPTLGGGEA